jgi:GAF domain-containing protein
MSQAEKPAAHGTADAQSGRLLALHEIHRLRDLVRCERGSMVFFDWEWQEVAVFAAEVDPNEIDTTGIRYSMIDLGEILPVLERGDPFVVHDMRNEIVPRVLDRFRDRGLRSVMAIPLTVDGRLIGCLAMMADREGAFGTDETDAGVQVAASLAIAIETQRLRDIADALEGGRTK